MPSNTRTRINSIGIQLKTLSLAVASALLTLNASAAGLGDLKVQSFLGQPLRAEVELVSMPGDTDAPLTVKIASYDIFQKANIEFNPALLSLRFTTEQRGDKKVVRISSTQPMNEPFIDMLLEVRTNNNAVVREYVFLLDPAGLGIVSAVVPEDSVTQQANANASQRPAPAAQAEKAPAPPKRPAPQKKPDVAQRPNDKSAPAAIAGKPRLTLTSPKIVGGPDDDTDRIPAKEYAAMEQSVAEANARVKALEQKVGDLQKLLEVTNSLLAELQKQKELERLNAAAQTAPASAAAVPTASAAPSLASVPASVEGKPVDAAGSTPTPSAATPAAVAPPKPVAAVPKPVAPPPEEDWYSDLLLLPGAALLLAGLGIIGLRLARRRKQAKLSEPSVLGESTLAPNSIRHTGFTLGAGLGSILPSSMNSDEVDVVAEADVYIAYGRDGQAEDLLKEALKTKPGNRAVSIKLLSIYATRKDRDSFAPLATELYRATKGEGEDWAEVAEMGRGIDPDNPMYIAKPATSVTALQASAASEPTVQQAISLQSPAQDDALSEISLKEFVLDKIDSDSSTASDDQPVEPSHSTKLTDEEEQLAELLSHPMSDEQIESETAEIASNAPVEEEMDVDLVMRQLDQPIYQPTTSSADVTPEQEAGIGPIDFDLLVPDIPVEAKSEAIPEIPSAALDLPKESGNLIEFDFLKPAEAATDKSEDLPEIPLALPVETAGSEEDAKLFNLEFLDQDKPSVKKG